MGVAKAYDPVLGQWVKIGRTGPQGPTGATYAIRGASDGFSSYVGQAPVGSSESAAVWTITKITLNSDGSVSTGIATDAVWADRLTEVYV